MLLPSFCTILLLLSSKLVFKLVVPTSNLLADGEGGIQVASLVNSTRERGA